MTTPVTPTMCGEIPVPNDRSYWLRRAAMYDAFADAAIVRGDDDAANRNRYEQLLCNERAARCTETSEVVS